MNVVQFSYPNQVLLNSTFQIQGMIAYSFPEVSGYSTETSSWIIVPVLYNSTYSLTPIRQAFVGIGNYAIVSGQGSKTFSIDVRAPPYPTTMNLTLYAMYQLVPAIPRLITQTWSYTHNANSWRNFNIKVSSTTSLVVVTNNSNMSLMVDGFQYHTNSTGALQLNVTGLTWHWVEVEATFNIGKGTREKFASWTDGTLNTEHSIYMDSMKSLTATYKTQYFLKIDGSTGSDWYDVSSVANITATNEIRVGRILTILGFREIFQGWTGDVESQNATLNIVMNEPHNLTAHWRLAFHPGFARLAIFAILVAVCVYIIYRTLRMRTANPEIERE